MAKKNPPPTTQREPTSEELKTISQKIDQQAPGTTNYRTGYMLDSSKLNDKDYFRTLESKLKKKKLKI